MSGNDWEELASEPGSGVVGLPDTMPDVSEDQNRRARPGYDKSCPHAWHLPSMNETHRCHLVADHPGKHLCSCGASQARKV